MANVNFRSRLNMTASIFDRGQFESHYSRLAILDAFDVIRESANEGRFSVNIKLFSLKDKEVVWFRLFLTRLGFELTNTMSLDNGCHFNVSWENESKAEGVPAYLFEHNIYDARTAQLIAKESEEDIKCARSLYNEITDLLIKSANRGKYETTVQIPKRQRIISYIVKHLQADELTVKMGEESLNYQYLLVSWK